MQEGSMRCDINISVREKSCETLGTRTEIKNMNSLKAIARAIEYEAQRHIDALETGTEELVQETRRWDDDIGMTYSMREKEEAADYRYFPNPELMPVHIDKDWIEDVRSTLPEPAHKKFARMTTELGLPDYDSKLISGSQNLSRIFDSVMHHFSKAKDVSNWILGELLAIAKDLDTGNDDIYVDAIKFASVIRFVDEGKLNRSTGKKVLLAVIEDGVDPEVYIEEHSMWMVSDTGFLEFAVNEVLAENEKSVAEYHAGSQKVFGFLVGQVMKKTAGKADPRSVNELLRRIIEE